MAIVAYKFINSDFFVLLFQIIFCVLCVAVMCLCYAHVCVFE